MANNEFCIAICLCCDGLSYITIVFGLERARNTTSVGLSSSQLSGIIIIASYYWCEETWMRIWNSSDWPLGRLVVTRVTPRVNDKVTTNGFHQ